jgi:hypothetical protein
MSIASTAGAKLLLEGLFPIRMAGGADVLQGLEMVSRQQCVRDYPRHLLSRPFCFQPVAIASCPPQFKRDRVERLRNEWRDLRRPQHRLDIENGKSPEGFGNSLGEFLNAAHLDGTAILVEAGIGPPLVRRHYRKIDFNRGSYLIGKCSHGARLSSFRPTLMEWRRIAVECS